MLEILVELASNFGGDYLDLAIALIISGVALLALNTISHILIEGLKCRRARMGLVTQTLHPVVNASEGLISRIVDIIITFQKNNRDELIKYKKQETIERIKDISPTCMTRHESTAFRLVNFLALSVYFQRKTSEITNFKYLETACYFLRHKIPVALRGNLYKCQKISTEQQEEIAFSFLANVEKDRAVDLTVRHFCSMLKNNEYDKDLYVKILELFVVDTKPLADAQDINRDSHNWCSLLTLAHLCVYLIDFYQEFERNSQWEEERILFVRLIKRWNDDSTRKRYLYEPGDVSTNNYLDTFPSHLTPPNYLFSMIYNLMDTFNIMRPFVRICKKMRLNIRGRRYHRRHDTKKITSKGITICTQTKKLKMLWNSELPVLYGEVQQYLKSRIAG